MELDIIQSETSNREIYFIENKASLVKLGLVLENTRVKLQSGGSVGIRLVHETLGVKTQPPTRRQGCFAKQHCNWYYTSSLIILIARARMCAYFLHFMSQIGRFENRTTSLL